MTTYIAGYDGSQAGRAAVRFATRLAAATGAKVVAATVHPSTAHLHGRIAADPADQLNAEARRQATELLEQLDVEGIERLAIGADSPAHGLHAAAEEREASLLVVGTTHRGPAGRLVIGSVGERLVHGSPCPITVVPADWDENAEIETVGVAYDGRSESGPAVRAAEHLAKATGARLVILSVYEPVLASYVAPGVPISSWDYDKELREQLEQEVAQLADGMPDELRAEAHVLAGPPARTLVEAAASHGLDVLVCGSRGYGPVRSVIVGAVSRHLVDHAPCPVLVVPRDVKTGVDTQPLSAATGEAS
jgi:nucleotide-binding universal stress UspA family protein